MSLVNRTFALFGKLLGSHRVAWNLLAVSEKRKRAVGKKKDKGSLGSCFSHIHTRPSTSEATADKNAKKKDEARITSRSCLWIAVCILHIWWLCVCDESESPDCQPKTKVDSWSYVSGALLGKIKWTIAAMRHTKRHTHFSQVKTL